MDLFLKYGINASFVPPVTGYMELLHDSGTLSSAVTSYNIPNLNVSKTDNLYLVITLIGPNNINSNLTCNGNNTSTNYDSQILGVNGTSFGEGRENSAFISNVFNNENLITAKIKITENGRFTWQGNTNKNLGDSGFMIVKAYGSSRFTISSITSLTYTATGVGATNGIGAGSRFQLYRVRD